MSVDREGDFPPEARETTSLCISFIPLDMMGERGAVNAGS